MTNAGTKYFLQAALSLYIPITRIRRVGEFAARHGRVFGRHAPQRFWRALF